MDVERLYSNELKKILTSMSKDSFEDYPMKKITTEHFILTLLNNKQCSVYKIISKILSQDNITKMYNYFVDCLMKNTINNYSIKKDTSVGYDSNLTKYLIDAGKEKDKLNDTKISSDHVFLSILNSEGLIKESLNHFSLEYDNYLSILNKSKSDDLENNTKVVIETLNLKNKTSNKKNGVESYCVNLNELARQGKIDELVGREAQINRIIKTLGRRNKNNIIFVGLPGTGKTAIVKGLAKMINDGKAKFLNGKTILSLNMTEIIAGTTFRGMLEEKMNYIMSDLKNNKDYILFIDDIHTVLSGQPNNSNDLSGILTNALSTGDIQLLATTSFKDYKNSIENNPTLNRRFQKIIINPTTIEETENILNNSKEYYENFHNVKYSNEAIKSCVYLANKYCTDRQLPDSAIDIMDECGSGKKTYDPKLDELVEMKKELELTKSLMNKSFKSNDFKLGDTYKTQAKMIESNIIDFEKKMKYIKNDNIKEITEIDVYNTVSEITGIPLNKISVSEKQKFFNIENILNSKVVGQEEAIKKISQTIKRSRMGLKRRNTPTGVFLCIGESGTGKTLLAKTLAEEIYGGENSLIRFDMSEYSDKTAVNKIIGTGSGYVGFDQGGLLTEAIKNKGYCVLLLDEIEKADKEILNIFLQVFDDGILTDNTGQKVSFKNVIIIMTSNIGAKDAAAFSRSTGFISNTEENKKNISDKALKQHFPPEFINRLDGVIYFKQLNDESLMKIIKIELYKLNNRLIEDTSFSIEYSDDLISFILDKVKLDDGIGARKITRIIQNNIENLICDLFLENEYKNNYIFRIKIIDNKIVIK